MKIEHFIYHENNLEKPYIPQEDYYQNTDNVFVVSDGITHDLVDGFYPNPSDSGKVANIICETISKELENSNKQLDDIKKAVKKANIEVKRFNESSELYAQRDSNGYTIGAAVFAVIVIKKNRLLYGVLDDCYFSIFSDDLVDHPTLKSYVDKSVKHFDANYNWSKPEDRKVWRKEYRNNEIVVQGGKLGYGAIDGREGFEQYVQYGEEILRQNDLICVYTDGFIKIMRDSEFIKSVKNDIFTMDTIEFISKYTRDKDIKKEKTCYFIKYKE